MPGGLDCVVLTLHTAATPTDRKYMEKTNLNQDIGRYFNMSQRPMRTKDPSTGIAQAS
jgi:hypothetical protein